MARLPNTPRPPKLAARSPGPASVRADAVVKRPPAPANRAVAMRGDANERPAKLRPASARPPICDPPKRATLKERRPSPAPPKRATPTERAPTPIPPKRATPKERAPPKPPPRAAKPPPCPPKPPPPPRASASSVKSGTAKSNIATAQRPAIDPRRLASDARVAAAMPRPRYQGRASCCAAACSASAVGRTLGYFHEGGACNPDRGAFVKAARPPPLSTMPRLSWFSDAQRRPYHRAPSMTLG